MQGVNLAGWKLHVPFFTSMSSLLLSRNSYQLHNRLIFLLAHCLNIKPIKDGAPVHTVTLKTFATKEKLEEE